MADLQSCYFCGDHEDVGAYAVVPPRFAPDEGEQRSVVLCDRCKDKLMTVVEPLVDRLEADADGRSAADAGGSTAEAPADDPAGPTADTGEPATGDGITFPGDDGADSPAEALGDVDAAASDTGGSGGSAGASPSGAGDSPPGYRKAMRMLSNRPFPVQRAEVVGLLSGAYDMEESNVEAILDHAVAAGRFIEEDGELRKA